ncbi:helix-turn-helix domain-containing protein [Solitalea lacus]|uniref:helix-turn-helix domain-containing protein n=1 Tax=Solitalea lacus TaxID=2911172 RepID=UPI001EDBB557|nr:helix-turn-helix domain-containing protein [Solitalea lacus]UKJ06392.1 helix-turn-helix domain-containing protein [Solitalea lacus]
MYTDFDYSHLRVTREQLGLTQKEAANASGISQRDISQLESGLKKFFPLAYILFLNHNGVNLNILFSNTLNIQNLITNRLGRIRSIDPETIQFNYSVFKIAREKVGLTQKQASERSGLSQRDISQLEAGLKKFIPYQFIQYLMNIKADLNQVFSYSPPEPKNGISTPIQPNLQPKNPEFSVKNKTPENRIFETQLTIDTEYSKDNASEISPELSLKVDHITNHSNNELNDQLSIDKNEPVSAVPAKEVIPNLPQPKMVTKEKIKLEPGIPLIKKLNTKNYIELCADEDFLNNLPSIKLHDLENGIFRAFEVSGREMEPLFYEGDIAVGFKVDEFESMKNNGLYILVNNKRIILRRIINCIKASNELILLTDNETIANEILKINELKEVWEFQLKITSSVDQLKNSFNELYFQLMKIQKDLEVIKSKL